MSVLHLLWIIPLATMFGFMACALLNANKEKNDGRYR